MTSITNGNKKIIYDIGANNGDDVPYYLKKADIVIAVEANPILCEQMQKRFALEIQQQKLVIENCVLTAANEVTSVPFYIHKTKHVLSQFPAPTHKPENYEKVFLPGKTVNQLFYEHGYPYYVKIDIEHYDHVILRSLLNNDIRPKYISAESHSIEVFILLASLGNYDAFKIVNGSSVATTYHNWPISTTTGEEVYSFPYHSAGPFGEDVAGEWVNSESLFRTLLSDGLGWKDIHAKKQDEYMLARRPSVLWRIRYWYYFLRWKISRSQCLKRIRGFLYKASKKVIKG
ncbi:MULTISPECIES: FkbM family methyltransferase [unclassified Moorena]|uniref:FkbM family methyltransferase n=2 Tax=Moorena TaxID=1155738 RepID=UPI0013B5E5BB|nr:MULTISPECIES: FkbM family methyltransferase [unclassified Moorena]NEP35151.1 FkbM family methyltransferase [Moorena sp. SIO3B2]NEQ04524.1 FkbM family methyltransferase [Moorena sp. SIO4E2]